MLARITGRLESLAVDAPPRALIAPLGQGEGVAYEVLLPAYLAQRLLAESGHAPLGSETGPVVTLYTLSYLESLNQGTSFIPRLIGFDSPREMDFFHLLTSVKGLGNKRALRALATSPGAVARAIVERDARFLQGLPEIGPKLADLIVHELKGKAEDFVNLSKGSATAAPPTASPSQAPSAKAKRPAKPETASTIIEPRTAAAAAPVAGPPPIRETINALIALGESPIDAERMVAKAMDKARTTAQVISSPGELLTLAYASR